MTITLEIIQTKLGPSITEEKLPKTITRDDVMWLIYEIMRLRARVKAIKTGIYTEPLPNYGDLITVKDWLQSVANNYFIDYDGSGHPVKDGKMSKQNIYPSIADELPEDATHVMWFNR